MIRVVHVIDSLRGGGAERLLEFTLPALRAQGIGSAVIYLNDESACLPGLVGAGIPTLCLRPGEPNGFRALQRSPRQRAEDLRRAATFCREFGADLLHAHLHGAYLFVPGLSRRLGVPYFVTEHSVADPWQTGRRPNERLLRRLYLRSYRGAACVVCVSPAVEFHLRHEMGIGGLRCRVIENAIADLFWTPIPSGERDYDVLMCGRLSHVKGYPLAVEAFAELRKRRPSFRAGIVGTGQLEGEIRASLARLELEAHVEMLGRRSGEEVRDLMDRSKVLFMPSVTEGLGIAAVEGLARGLRAVLSDIPTFRHAFGDLDGVRLIPADPVRAAEVLDAEVDAPLVDRAASLATYTLKVHCAAMAAQYRSVLSNPL